MSKIQQGDKIPEFEIPDQTGETFRSESLKGKKCVIFFYPKDETPGCTKEACAFRDAYEDFKEADAEVIGISSDGIKTHQSFISNHNLPFTLLSDEDKSVRKMFGVPSNLLGLIPGRVTYVANSKGIVEYIFNSQLNTQGHIDKALEVIKKIY